MKPIVFERALYIGESPLQLLRRVKFSELETARSHNLSGGRTYGNSLRHHLTYEIVRHCNKANSHAIRRAVGLRLNIGKASGGKERLHGVVQGLAAESFSVFERGYSEQA